jgi:hypothetical protein
MLGFLRSKAFCFRKTWLHSRLLEQELRQCGLKSNVLLGLDFLLLMGEWVAQMNAAQTEWANAALPKVQNDSSAYVPIKTYGDRKRELLLLTFGCTT